MGRTGKAVILIIILAALVCVMIAVINMGTFSIPGLKGEKVTGFEAKIQGINTLDISAVSENVEIISADGDVIKVEEIGPANLKENEKIKCSVSEGILYIKSDKGFIFGWGANTLINVYVPKEFMGKLNLSNTSGELLCGGNENSFSDIDIKTVSGSVDMRIKDANKADITSVSGEIYYSANSTKEIVEKTVSGEALITLKNLPNSLDVNTTSGEVKIYLPKNNGINLNSNSVSGSIDNEFAADLNGADITVNTVSGEISIKENK